MRKEIQSFQQRDGDFFFEARGHFNELLLKCPHHNLPQDELVQAFYEVLNDIVEVSGTKAIECGKFLILIFCILLFLFVIFNFLLFLN